MLTKSPMGVAISPRMVPDRKVVNHVPLSLVSEKDWPINYLDSQIITSVEMDISWFLITSEHEKNWRFWGKSKEDTYPPPGAGSTGAWERSSLPLRVTCGLHHPQGMFNFLIEWECSEHNFWTRCAEYSVDNSMMERSGTDQNSGRLDQSDSDGSEQGSKALHCRDRLI